MCSCAFGLAFALFAGCGGGGANNTGGTGGTGAGTTSSNSSSSTSGSQGGGGGEPTLVDTDKGPVSGTNDGNVRSFLGIPYAAPPVGPLRWKPPQPAAPWTDTLAAVTKGVFCPQLSALGNTPMQGTSEDCLTLNIWTPGKPTPDLRPVLVWIHGGGFVIGSGSEATYDGAALAQATGAMVVTINYRLGPLGWLAHGALAAEDPAYPSSGMYGFEDQRAAIAWVKANAQAFRGDPNNITIFGESAGGISTCLQVLSPKSAGLFQRAIIESGACSIPGSTEKSAEAQGDQLATALGCTDPTKTLECLRGKTPDELLTALPGKPAEIGPGGAAWVPVVDGVNMPDQPATMLASGNFNKVAVLIGSNKDEGTIFFNLGLTVTSDADYLALMDGMFYGQGMKIVAQYPPSAYGGSYSAAAAAAVGDGFFGCPTRRTARAFAAGGQPTYLYHFEHGPKSLFGDLGAFHSSEVPFIFRNPYIGIMLDDAEKALSDTMIGYWSSFAKKADPNGGSAPMWPAYVSPAEQAQVLDLTVKTTTNLLKTNCDFWDGLGP
jgi:para-nitrobenzyl esterase